MQAATKKPQHLSALDRANSVYRLRAKRKREVRDGARSAASVLPLEEMQTCKVQELLRAQHRWGFVRADAALFAAGIPRSFTVQELTERQRAALLEVLGS